ncbi:MAG: DsbA family oxidoreductase [Chitinophagaceae bacterium]|nr:DsbA family oxidoreductase [Chitinophagaceae bacterium]
MKVEIWSDIMCPFCYIGKRNFEEALRDFPDAQQIEVEWKSFQLDPSIVSGTGKNVYAYLADRKGISYDHSVQMHQQVVQVAAAAGLAYNFDKAVVANSYNAHRLIQLAKRNSLGDAAEERLFKAYFTEGRDLGDTNTLIELAKETGLKEEIVKEVLQGESYADAVNDDIREAEQAGIRGVPFFVFNRKYAVSGAQPPDVFREALRQSFKEWQLSSPQPKTVIANEASCSIQGDCTV